MPRITLKTLTKGEILEIGSSLKALSMMNTKAWYEIGKNQKRFEPIIQSIFKEKQNIFNDFPEKDKDGNILYTDNTKSKIQIKQDKKTEASDRWDNIKSESIDVEVYQFSVDKLQELELSPILLMPLIDIIIIDD